MLGNCIYLEHPIDVCVTDSLVLSRYKHILKACSHLATQAITSIFATQDDGHYPSNPSSCNNILSLAAVVYGESVYY